MSNADGSPLAAAASRVTAPIIGTRTPTYLDDLLGAVGWSLTPQQLERLDLASQPEWPPYPYFG